MAGPCKIVLTASSSLGGADFGEGLQMRASDDDDGDADEEEGGQAHDGALVLDGGDPLTGAAEDAAILISLAFPDRIAQRRNRSNRWRGFWANVLWGLCLSLQAITTHQPGLAGPLGTAPQPLQRVTRV